MMEAPTPTTPMKAKVTPSAKKVMASIFWDLEGLLLVDYPQIVKPINRESYADYLQRLRDNIKQKRPENTDQRGSVPSGQRCCPQFDGGGCKNT